MMDSRPRLVPVPPSPGRTVILDTSPFRVGAAAGCELRLYLPAVPQHQAVLLEREDGCWISPASPACTALFNGESLAAARRLSDGDVLQFAPGAVYRFADPAVAAAAAAERQAAIAARAQPTYYEAVAPVSGAPRRLPRAPRFRAPRFRASRTAAVALACACVIALLGSVWLARGLLLRASAAPVTLSDEDAALFDELMEVAYEEIERGTALLDAGVPALALQRFARAVNVLETSRLRDNEWIRPRIRGLEAAIAEIYRAKRMAVPERYRDVNGSFDLAALLRAELSRDQFGRGVELLNQRFAAQFGRDIVVTGRDHAEHVSLYGAGGAIDVRVRDLSQEQIAFIIENARAMGIRVKDFSSDSVLADQIRRAHAAGLSDRAGTGVHLHLDRFASRRDRYTVD